MDRGREAVKNGECASRCDAKHYAVIVRSPSGESGAVEVSICGLSHAERQETFARAAKHMQRG